MFAQFIRSDILFGFAMNYVLVGVVVLVILYWMYTRTQESAVMPPPMPMYAAPVQIGGGGGGRSGPVRQGPLPMAGRRNDPPSGNSVRIYDGANYTGQFQNIGLGKYPLARYDMANKVSSIYIPAGRRVDLYTEKGCSGVPLTLTSSVPRLSAYDIGNKAKCAIISSV